MLNATDATQVTFLGEFLSRGRRWNAYSDGTVLPVIAGGDGTGDAGDQGSAGGDGADGGNAAKFTQADMNATVARETAAAKARAEQEMATALGVSLDEAKRLIAAARAADDAKKTEAERAAEAWKAAQTSAEQIAAEAARERHDAKVERALGRAGLDVDNEILLAAGLAAVKLDVGADGDAIKAAVEKAKTDAPQLFGAATTAPSAGKHTDPGQQRKDPTAPTGEFGAKGAEEARRRWGQDQKQPA